MKFSPGRADTQVRPYKMRALRFFPVRADLCVGPPDYGLVVFTSLFHSLILRPPPTAMNFSR